MIKLVSTAAMLLFCLVQPLAAAAAQRESFAGPGFFSENDVYDSAGSGYPVSDYREERFFDTDSRAAQVFFNYQADRTGAFRTICNIIHDLSLEGSMAVIESHLNSVDILSAGDHIFSQVSSRASEGSHRCSIHLTKITYTASGNHRHPLDILADAYFDSLVVPDCTADPVQLVPLDPLSLPEEATALYRPCILIHPEPYRHATGTKVSIPSGVSCEDLSIYCLEGLLVRTTKGSGESITYFRNGSESAVTGISPGACLQYWKHLDRLLMSV